MAFIIFSGSTCRKKTRIIHQSEAKWLTIHLSSKYISFTNILLHRIQYKPYLPSLPTPLLGAVLRPIEEGASVFTNELIYNIHWKNSSSIYFENKGNNSKRRSIINLTRNTDIFFKTRGLILNRWGVLI